MQGAGGNELAVRVSLYARAQFRSMKERGVAAPGSTHAALWRATCEIVKKLGRADIALEATYALRDDLANVFRVKSGRNRIFYIVSSAKRQVTILMVGFRKQGDSHDAYEELRRKLRSTEFDDLFAELGVAKPKP